MLRHYSSSRIAVLSIVVPVCAGILALALAKPAGGDLTIYLLLAEAVLFTFAVALSFFFSSKYEQIRQALVRLEAGEKIFIYNSIVGSRSRGKWKPDAIDKSIMILGILLHSAYYLFRLI
jgi:hypothetical protein